MNFELVGNSGFQLAKIYLGNGETAKIENGAMVYMQDVTLEGKLNSKKKGLGGFLGAMAKSILSDESIFITQVMGTSADGVVAIAPSVPGTIAKLEVGARQYRLNDSAFFASRAAIPLLKKGSHPSIINYSTIAVTSGGGPGAGIYAASKAAIEGLTRAMAKDLAEYGIRVNAVSPGTIDTQFHAATKREIVESWKDSIVMKRLGEPSEVASVIEFLASEKASFITGEIIQVNGGQAFI